MSKATKPQVSVLIATHNRGARLTRCIESLAAQDVDPEVFELIVADDGSDDGSTATIEALEVPFDLRVLRLPKGGKAAAVNAAIEHACGPICILLDDDVIAAPMLISAYMKAHEENPMTLGLGSIYQQAVEAKDWYAHAFAAGWNRIYAERTEREAAWNDCYGANMSAPLAALKEVGGLSALATAEDIELGYRLTRFGCVPRFVPDAKVTHDDQKRSTKMLAEMRLQGKVHVEVARERPELASTLLSWGDQRFRGERRLRRALVWTHTSPRFLTYLGPAVPQRYTRLLSGLIKQVAFWQGVRSAVDDAEWAILTQEPKPADEA
jgi:glycosyltransferase involved in cell wall biosynthesis